MSRVRIASQPWGVVQDTAGNVRAAQTVTITDLAGATATVYAGSSGATTTSPTTNAHGELAGWLPEGQYLLDTGAGAVQVEAVTGGARDALFQSTGGYVPDGSGIPNINGPNTSKVGLGGIYSDSGTGNIFHSASYVANYGTRATVGVLGFGKGAHVFGANLVGYTDGAAHAAIGCEIDYGNLNATPGGTATGLLIRSLGGNVGGQGGQVYLQMQAAASSSAGDGIVFNPSAGVPAVASTGALIKATGENAAEAMYLSGSKFTTAAIYAPLNSGSTTASFALLLSAEGGFANAGAFIDIRAGAASSSALNGIVFRLSGSNQPITGSLIKVQGAVTASIGLDLASGTFTQGIAMGDNNITVGTTTGMKIGTATTQKLGLYNATPVVQYSTTGTSTGFTAGAGTTATSLSTFTGNVGSTAYTVGDVVRALKVLGVMAA